MNVLITGINGFVGKNLRKCFSKKKGFAIIGVSRSGNGNSGVISWDQFYDGQSSANTWVHLAGKAHDVSGKDKTEEYVRINTELTQKVFEKFLHDAQAETFIYFSSVKAVASSVKGVLVEEDVYAVDNPYGASKRAAEEFLLSQKLPSQKKLVILRPCMIHGPGNKGNLNLLYKFVQKGIPYPLAAFKNKRSFLSINNLLFALEQIITKPDFPSGVYNIADDESLSTKEVVNLIGEASGKSTKIWSVSPTAINLVARIGDVLHLPINSHRLDKLTESYVVSNEKIKKALGIKSFPVSAKEGLHKTIKSFSV